MGRVNLNREQYERLNSARRSAFKEIAKKLGPKHKITKMMGGLAWGRHRAEQGPGGNLRSSIEEFGYLNGFYDALNLWARDHDHEAQRVMTTTMPTGYTGAGE